jgi:hypothetical protein
MNISMLDHIVIVGGGTAGWMAGIAIASRFPQKRVTVVDPAGIPPLGVGESVTGVVLAFVNDPVHRLSKGEFFRRCDVTFKMGIYYKGWRGPGDEYLSPIDNPPDYLKYYYNNSIEDFYASMTADGQRVGESVLYGKLMRAVHTDHLRAPDGSVDGRRALGSSQFDSLKFAAWLKETATGRENIRWVDGVVESFDQDPVSGHVTRVKTKDGQAIDGDFFLDCSGFHRLLFAKAYKPGWISYREHIRVDSAIPIFPEHPEGKAIPCYTVAQAMPHGWLWTIPTQSRLGRGYVFGSRYADVPQAVADMRAAGIDPGDNPRVIRFDPGRFDQLWIGNVCTVGLSGGFIEPLESSTIHGMFNQVSLLVELYLPHCTRDNLAALAPQYNRLVSAAYEDYMDFISFHYHAGRTDTEFWRDCQKPSSITPANQYRIEKWKHAYPVAEDFPPSHTQRVGLTLNLVAWAPALCGLGHLRQDLARRQLDLCRQPKLLQENLQRYVALRNTIVAASVPHAEAIAYSRSLP